MPKIPTEHPLIAMPRGTLAQLHADAQVAVIVWKHFFPASHTEGLLPLCTEFRQELAPGVMSRSLAVMTHTRVQLSPAADVRSIIDDYDNHLLDWDDAKVMLEAALRYE